MWSRDTGKSGTFFNAVASTVRSVFWTSEKDAVAAFCKQSVNLQTLKKVCLTMEGAKKAKEAEETTEVKGTKEAKGTEETKEAKDKERKEKLISDLEQAETFGSMLNRINEYTRLDREAYPMQVLAKGLAWTFSWFGHTEGVFLNALLVLKEEIKDYASKNGFDLYSEAAAKIK